jgi:hypothetical protein
VGVRRDALESVPSAGDVIVGLRKPRVYFAQLNFCLVGLDESRCINGDDDLLLVAIRPSIHEGPKTLRLQKEEDPVV